MTKRGLTGAELHRAAHLAHEAADDPRGDLVPQALLDELVELVPCFDISYVENDVTHGRNVGFQDVDPTGTNPSAPVDDSDGAIFQMLLRERSRRHLYESGPSATDVVRTFDFYSEREWRSSDIYAETYCPCGEWNSVIAPVPSRNGVRRLFIFMRDKDEGAFSDRDRDLLMLLQPQLTALADARQRQRNVVPLTDRHREVLRHLAAGLSTEEIARQMFVSPTTVRKHIENIFARLGVSSRAAAVAQGLQLAE
jgi:DNA-binding CsgD family transcriptional regulator